MTSSGATRVGGASGARSTLLISENAPVPADRRVMNEARALREEGWAVSVACAADAGGAQPAAEVVDGIDVHRYPLQPAGSAVGYAREYAQASWRLRRLVRELAGTRTFDVVHAANPPDVLLGSALALRRRGARMVFDHHDLVPELFRERFGGGPGLRVALAGEQLAYRLADVVIATNASYRRVALERGRRDPEDVFVVRNGPDTRRFTPVDPDPALRRGAAHLLAYVGIMGPQDGIDGALRALARLHATREDWHAVFVGTGDVVPAMEQLARELGLGARVEFAGWRGDDDLRSVLSAADVCLAPDPPGPLNDHSTMMKIPEYLAMGRPVVSYDLPESRVSAGEAAVYAPGGDEAAFAALLGELLDDPGRRAAMGRAGAERVRDVLAWERSIPPLLAAYERALARPRP